MTDNLLERLLTTLRERSQRGRNVFEGLAGVRPGDAGAFEQFMASPAAGFVGPGTVKAVGGVRNVLERELFALRDQARASIARKDFGEFRNLIEEAPNDESLEVLRRALDESGFNPDRYIPKTRFSPAKNKTLSVEEMEGALDPRKK